MKFSSEPPTAALVPFCGEFEIEIFERDLKIDQDRKFRAKFNFFDRWALWVVLSPELGKGQKITEFGV